MKYEEAIWKWFVANASKDGRWGYASLSSEEGGHLAACGINAAKSQLPEIGTVTEWGNTLNPEVRTPAVYAETWVCNCGTYGSDYRNVTHSLTLAVTGSRSLGDIIREVIEAGEK